MDPARNRANVLVLSLALLGASMGCANDCPGDLIRFEGGITNSSRTYYQSSPIEGPFLHFPGGRAYEFVHGLRERPSEVHAWVSFSETPLIANEGSMAESAGNQSSISIGDEVFRVHNATCAEFWLYVVANTPPEEPDASTSDAGTVGDAAAE
jgi:hypothetical protein